MGDLLRKLRRRFGEGEDGKGKAPDPAPSPGGVDEPREGRDRAPSEDTRAAGAAGEQDREDVLEGLRRRIAALDKRWKGAQGRPPVETPRTAALEVLPGRFLETERGPLRVVEDLVPRAAGHGRFAVGDFGAVSVELRALGSLYRLRSVPLPEGLVFLDTETTGLAGGAGTLPFLVGLAWLEGGDLRVEQLFLDHPRNEPAMVAHLLRRLSAFTHVVTYNGRAFDVPLLQNRFVLHRTPWPSLDASLDLLAGARRLHRRHLDDRSLTSIERNVLGFFREDDVPGAEIPAVYHRFLFTGNTERLAGVIRHNVWDVVAMAALLGLQARLLSLPAAAHDLPPAVDLALGELHCLAADHEAAIEHLKRAVARSESGGAPVEPAGVWAQALGRMAHAHRRRGRPDEAAACWQRILDAIPGHGPAHLALAKHHEHRTRRWREAAAHARAAEAAGAEELAAAERRAARIAGKTGERPV